MKSGKDKSRSRFALRKYLAVALFSLALAAIVNIEAPCPVRTLPHRRHRGENHPLDRRLHGPRFGDKRQEGRGNRQGRSKNRAGGRAEAHRDQRASAEEAAYHGPLIVPFSTVFLFRSHYLRVCRPEHKEVQPVRERLHLRGGPHGLHGPADKGHARGLRKVRSGSCGGALLHIPPLSLRHCDEDHPLFGSRPCFFDHSRHCGSIPRGQQPSHLCLRLPRQSCSLIFFRSG